MYIYLFIFLLLLLHQLYFAKNTTAEGKFINERKMPDFRRISILSDTENFSLRRVSDGNAYFG